MTKRERDARRKRLYAIAFRTWQHGGGSGKYRIDHDPSCVQQGLVYPSACRCDPHLHMEFRRPEQAPA